MSDARPDAESITVFDAFGHYADCNMWEEGEGSVHLNRDKSCTCRAGVAAGAARPPTQEATIYEAGWDGELSPEVFQGQKFVRLEDYEALVAASRPPADPDSQK